jgi:hypothetical protein
MKNRATAPSRPNTQASEFDDEPRRSYVENECSCSAGHDVTSGRLEDTAPTAIRMPMPNSVSPETTRMMRTMIAAIKSRSVGAEFIGILPVLDL